MWIDVVSSGDANKHIAGKIETEKASAVVVRLTSPESEELVWAGVSRLDQTRPTCTLPRGGSTDLISFLGHPYQEGQNTS